MSEVHKFYIKGHEVLIDKDNMELVSRFKWRINKTGFGHKSIRATTHFNNIKSYIDLHRLLMNAKKGQIVDHINRNVYDNRMCNLRFCTFSQNSKNKTPSRKSTSKYLGVCIDNGYKKSLKFRSSIGIGNKKVLNLGIFTNEIEAAKAYNEAAIKYHGEFANLNKFE